MVSLEIAMVRPCRPEIGFPQEGPTVVLNDNDCALDLAISGGITEANKHVDTKGHICKYLHATKEVEFRWTGTKTNLADIGTKNMKDAQQFRLLRDCLVTSKPD